MQRFRSLAMTAGLVLAASAANAQMQTPYRAVSDFDGPYERPYAAVPPAPPVYDYGSNYGAGPALLPPLEVYTVLRENGFSPLGVPHQRGFVYTIAALDRSGRDGRLVIDARNGQIIRFVPSYSYGPYGGNFEAERMSGYGSEVALPPPTVIRGTPRPPAPVPHAASRAVPLPTAKPAVAARSVERAQQSAAAETRSAMPPATAQATAPPPALSSAHASVSTPPATATVGEAKPAPAIQPTREMPKVQGLE